MGPVWMRAVSEVRARKRALLSAAILCGLFGAAALATLAGARRTETAYPRFLERNHGYDLLVSDSSLFSDVFWKVDFDVFARIPYVDRAVPLILGGIGVVGNKKLPEAFILGSTDPRFGSEINRPLVIEGRLADPSKVGEITIPYFADGELGKLRVGNRLTAQVQDETFPLEVVGRTVVPGELPPQPQFGWPAVVTPAFLAKYQSRLGFVLPSMMIRFDRRSDVVRLEREAGKLTGGKVFAPQEQESHTRAVHGSTSLQAQALKLLAIFIALTGLMIVGQLLARESALAQEDAATLRSLGFDRWQLFRLGILRATPVAVVGTAVAVGVAWAASPLFPRGSTRVLESKAPVFDPLVLGVGAVAIALAVVLLVLVPAWRAALSAGRPERAFPRPSAIATAVAAAGLSVPAVAGARLALERGRGRTAVPVFSSLLVVSIGIASVIAATTFGTSLKTMTERRDLQGKTWDQVINTVAEDEKTAAPAEAERIARLKGEVLARDPDIEALAFADSGAPLRMFAPRGPKRGVPILGLVIVNLKGSLFCPIVEGRAPRDPGDVVLGARMIKALGIRIDPAHPPTIEVAFQGSEGRRAPLRVVGRGVIPPLGNFGELGYGEMMGDFSAFEKLVDDPSSAPPLTDLLVRWRKGVNPKKVIARYHQRFPDVNLGEDLSGGRFADVVSFGGVEGAPLAVGGVLAGLGAAALAHVLVTAIRRRRRDVAILKTIGFVRGQARRVVAWQATIMVIIAAAVGVPLGIVVGRSLWNVVANGIGVLPRPQFAHAVLYSIGPAVLVLANLIAAPPARSAARTQPALVLRSE